MYLFCIYCSLCFNIFVRYSKVYAFDVNVIGEYTRHGKVLKSIFVMSIKQ